MLDAIFSLDTLYWILLVLYIPACFGLIIIVLLQKGKGTGFAGAFGVGPGSETVFGPRARQSLPVRLTYIAAAAFMLIALLMSMISGRVGKGDAPELAEVTQQETPVGSGLEGLGLGSGEAGAGLQDGQPAEESQTEGSAAGGAEEPATGESGAGQSGEQGETPPDAPENEPAPESTATSAEAPPAESPLADEEPPAEEQDATPDTSEEETGR